MGSPSASEVTYRRVRPDDADYLADQLAITFPDASIEQYRTLFDLGASWRLPDLGTVVMHGDRIVGYVGNFESRRLIGGQEVIFSNVGTWWVDAELRGGKIGRAMVPQFFAEHPNSITTFLTLPQGMRKFWSRFGLVPFEQNRRVYPWVMMRPPSVRRGARKLTTGELPEALPQEARRILTDHEPLRCQVAVFEAQGRYCGVVTRRRTVTLPAERWSRVAAALGHRLRPAGEKRGWRMRFDRVADLLSGTIPCAEVFYASDRTFFRDHFPSIARTLCRDQRAIALLADAERIGMDPQQGIPIASEYFFHGTPTVPISELDALYSEFFVLPLGQESR